MTYLVAAIAFLAGFITARKTAKPETLPCLCQDTTLPLRDPVEKAAGEVH